jgi:hypothetical protein
LIASHSWSIAASLVLSAVLSASGAHADPMDLALNRLSLYNNTPWRGGGVTYDPARWTFRGGCGTAATVNGAQGSGQAFAQCLPDNELWANLVNELGGALAPSISTPAMTLGLAGVYVGYEVAITNLNRLSQYWARGTEGSASINAGSGTASIRDRGDSAAVVSRLHVRKGLPFGFEIGTQASYLHSSSIWAIGLDLRWSPFEGFRRGVGYLPDIAVRAAVNTVVGQSQLNLTIVDADVSLSKRFTVGGSVRLTPVLGAQMLFIFGDSGVIDFTPSRSANAECPRQEVRYVADANSPSMRSGQLQCGSGAPLPSVGGQSIPAELNDTRNNGVFAPMRIRRVRGFFGLQFQWEILTIMADMSIDLADPAFFSEPSSDAGRPATTGTPTATVARTPISFAGFSQWTTNVAVGLTFR